MSKCSESDNYALHPFFPYHCICWDNALSRTDSGISASDFFIILITFSKTSSDFLLILCSTASMQRQTLLPYSSNSSTFLSRACFTLLTWFCNKVTTDLSFSLGIALTLFKIYFFNSETKSHLNELSFSSNFFSSSSMVYIFGGMLRPMIK